MKNVLTGKEWHKYLIDNDLTSKGQMQLYSGVTYKYNSIFKLGDYYFIFGINRGYKNISSLKKVISLYS